MQENKKMTLEQMIVNILKEQRLTISFAESCTGGMLASTLINAGGASSVLSESYITYSNEAKIKILGVKPSTIEKYSVYSKEVAKEMAEGLIKVTKTNIAISVTGIAGENDNTISNGSCDYAILINIDGNNYLYENHYNYLGTRNEVRKAQTTAILKKLLYLLNNNLINIMMK